MSLHETVLSLVVRTCLNKYELAMKLEQLVHLHAQGRPEKQTECQNSFFICPHCQAGKIFNTCRLVPIFAPCAPPCLKVTCTSPVYKSCHPVSESHQCLVALVVCWSITTQVDKSTCPKQSMYSVDVVALQTMRAPAVSPQDCPAGARHCA